MENYVKEIRLQEWEKLISAANNSGIPRSQWLKENHITKDAFYYWNRKVRKHLAEQTGIDTTSKDKKGTSKSEVSSVPSLVEIPLAAPVNRSMPIHPAAVINIGSMSISIASNASAEFMENLGRMLHNAL